jgi:hypothetical protein
MIFALILAAAAATATPQAHTGVSGASNPAAANSSASRTFSGGHVKPIGATSEPLLQKAAPKPNVNATAGPLLRKAAPAASTNPQGRQALGAYAGAGTAGAAAAGPGTHGQRANWGWIGLFGVFGLVGLWRRATGA